MRSELTPERLTADDLPGMLDYEIVARFDAVYAALDAAEAEVARLRERVSFGNHKRHQCEDNLSAAEARLAALCAAGDAMAGYAETLLGVLDNPVYRVDLVTFLGRWRALRGTGEANAMQGDDE